MGGNLERPERSVKGPEIECQLCVRREGGRGFRVECERGGNLVSSAPLASQSHEKVVDEELAVVDPLVVWVFYRGAAAPLHLRSPSERNREEFAEVGSGKVSGGSFRASFVERA